MNKFFLTVISVSIFFIGLGGMIKQIGSQFKSGDPETTPVGQFRRTNMVKEKIESAKTLTIIEKNVLPDGKERIPGGDLKFRMVLPNQSPKTVEFRRQLSDQPLERGVEFPRLPAKSVLIIKERPGENPEVSESCETEALPVRVLIDEQHNPRQR